MLIDATILKELMGAAGSRDELCGVLLGQHQPLRVEQLIYGRNLDAAPQQRYLLDAATLLRADSLARASGRAVLGFFHSHPHGPAVPSLADRNAMWPGYVYLIAAASGSTPYACAWVLRARGLSIAPILFSD